MAFKYVKQERLGQYQEKVNHSLRDDILVKLLSQHQDGFDELEPALYEKEHQIEGLAISDFVAGITLDAEKQKIRLTETDLQTNVI